MLSPFNQNYNMLKSVSKNHSFQILPNSESTHIYRSFRACFYAGNTKTNLAYFRRKFPCVHLRRCNQTNFHSKLKNYRDIDAKKYDLLEVPRTRLARCDICTL